jgi:hypothetical protein
MTGHVFSRTDLVCTNVAFKVRKFLVGRWLPMQVKRFGYRVLSNHADDVYLPKVLSFI